MKTTKLALMLILLSFGMIAFAQSDFDGTCKRVPLAEAIQNPQLVQAMYQQIDQRFIQSEQNAFYFAKVNFGHTEYLIYGKLYEWQNFFLMDPKGKVPCSDAFKR